MESLNNQKNLTQSKKKPYNIIMVFSSSCGACHHFKNVYLDDFKKMVNSNFSNIIDIKEKELSGFSTSELSGIHKDYPQIVGWFPFISMVKKEKLSKDKLEASDIYIFNGEYNGHNTNHTNENPQSINGYQLWITKSLKSMNEGKIDKKADKIIKDLNTLQKLTLKNN